MAQVCTDGSFQVLNGKLAYGKEGGYGVRADLYQDASNDGSFSGNLGLPGRTHNDVTVSWTNNTGVDHWVFPEVETGPRLVITTTPVGCYFSDGVSFVTGVGVTAPVPTLVPGFRDHAISGVAITSYRAENRRIRFGSISTLLCRAGETASLRYKCAFGMAYGNTASTYNTKSSPKFEARTRFAWARILSAPVGTEFV